MTATVTLEFPEDVLVAALRRLTPARRRQSVRLETETVSVLWRASRRVGQWTGIIVVGGDALEDSERLYSDG